MRGRRTGAALLAWAALAVVGVPAAHAATAPFQDLESKGGISLCDAQGKALTSGSTLDKPFVSKAVSTYTPGKPWDGPGHTAVLYAYQPVKDQYPDLWNGDSLTAASEYVGEHPAAVATGRDFSLGTYLKEFPVQWDGLVQLRMIWGARTVGFQQRAYASAIIKITGSRWTAVQGIESQCSQGKAASTEVTIADLNPTPRSTAPAGSSSSPVPSTRSAPSASSSGAPPTTTDVVSSSGSGSSHGSSALAFVLVGGGSIGVLLVLILLVLSRRRRLTAST